MGKRTIIKRGIILVGLLLFGMTTVQAEEKDIVAKVGNRVITKAEFEALLKKRGGIPPKDKQLEIGLLQNMVQTIALGEAARKKGLDKRKDIQETLALTIDSVLANELIKEEVINKVHVTEAQAKSYYDKNLARFKTPEQVKIRHILIKVDQSASGDDRKKARERAGEALKKIKSGEDFAKLAGELSDDPVSKAKGGDLGFFEKGRMVKPFDEAAFALNPGEVSNIVETPFGYHIIKMDDRKKEEIQLFEKLQDKVMAMAVEEIKREKIKEFVQQVMKNADSKIFADRFGEEKK